jgi:pyrimidine operon attenuation protein / uracil phosphoribosyltransferase
MAGKKYILDATAALRKLQRMAYEIAERNMEEERIILAGIKENGVVIAHKLQHLLADIFKGSVVVAELGLDKRHPGEVSIEPAINFDDAVIIVVDDVANSGKTMLYALKPFLQFHPKKIQTLALVERSHKAFPIQPDYTGLSISTTLQEHIIVEVSDGEVAGAWME